MTGAISVSTQGVEKPLSNLNPTKAAGPDGIPPRVLRQLAREVAPILTKIYQSSPQTGEMPRDWRERPWWRWCSRRESTTTLPITGPSSSPASPTYPCELHHATPRVKQHPPTAGLSKEQILRDTATQIYQRSLSSNGEMYHNRGHHNGLHQSFQLSQPASWCTTSTTMASEEVRTLGLLTSWVNGNKQ